MTIMKTSLKASFVAAAIAGLPFGSHAAGLGALNVFSALGQPLRAEIELQATPQELQSLTARVAPPAAFREANVAYSPVMGGLRLAVETRGNRSIVRVTSDRPVNEPFVELLVEVNWAAGRLLREYTFLLDPADMAPPPAVAATPAAGAVAPSVAPAARPAARPAAAAPQADSYRVRRGDTLHAIASRHQPGGVNLDQMLIALLRNNPDAFAGQNINRLRAGAILRIPDAETVRATGPAEARREIVAQAADFEAYRSRLAGTVAARPAAPEQPATRESVGEIVPRVADAPQPEASTDRVEVTGAPGAAEEGGRLARLQALEEELVARERALDEANERLVELEKSIRDLQRLIELRNESLAQLQQQVSPGAPAVPERAQSEGAPGAQPSAAAPPAQAPRPPVQPLEPQQPTFLQTMLEDPMLLAGGGGVLALLLGYAGYKVRSRRKPGEGSGEQASGASQFPAEAQSVFGTQGGQSVDTGSSILHTDFSQSGLASIDADEGVDPVAEADVYMAYGRDAQAEEILLDALKADASRAAIYLKLLEIYAQRRNLKQFEAVATDLYSRTGGEGEDWKKAAAMGSELDPDNPLYGDRSGAGDAAPFTQPGHGFGASAGAAATGVAVGAAALGGAGAGASGSQGGASLDLTDSGSLQDLAFTTSVLGETSASQLKDTWAMPGNLEEQAALRSRDSGDGVQAKTADAEAADSPLEGDFSVLDFDLDAPAAGGASSAQSAAEIKADDEDMILDFEFEGGTTLDAQPDEKPAQGAKPSRSTADDDIDLTVAQSGDAGVDAVEFDLDTDVPAAPSASADSMSATVIGDEIDLGLAEDAFGAETPTVAPSAGQADESPSRSMSETVIFGDVGHQADDDEVVLPSDEEGRKTTNAFDPDATVIESSALAGDEPSSVMDLEESNFDNDLLDFDFDLEPGASKTDAAAPTPGLDLSGIDLDLDLPEVPSASEEAAPRAAPSAETLQEVDTKLDLARAYEEMGDKEGARELLQEVLGEGSQEQREKAKRLLEAMD